MGASNTGGPTMATGVFDHVGLRGTWPAGGWRGARSATARTTRIRCRAAGTTSPAAAFTVTGSGDIAPDTNGGAGPGNSVQFALVGTFFGLIAVVVVGAMFITAEYRRGLIRTTLAASPRRGRVLAAKAIVIGSVAFVAGLVAAIVAIPLSTHVSRANGNYIYPVSALTEARLVIGTAALLAVAAVLAMAVGAALRRSAYAVTLVILVIVLPYLVAVTNLLSASGDAVAAAAGPGRGLLRPAGHPELSAGERRLLARDRLLPAGPVERVRGAVRLGRGRAGPGRGPVAPEGRMSQALQAPRAGTGRHRPRRDLGCGMRCMRSGPSFAPRQARSGCCSRSSW